MKKGATRVCWVVGRYALKFPRILSWRLFLNGLLANLQERTFSKTKWPELCPVLLADPIGLVVIMPAVTVMTPEQFSAFDATLFTDKKDYVIPAEHKADSFGWLDGKVVAIDYG